MSSRVAIGFNILGPFPGIMVKSIPDDDDDMDSNESDKYYRDESERQYGDDDHVDSVDEDDYDNHDGLNSMQR